MTKEILTLNDMLDAAAAERGPRTALVTRDESLTFSEFRDRTLKTAAGFSKRGVRPGDCVAIVARNSVDFLLAYFGLCRLGAVAVPINYMVQKADELAYMLNDCRAVGVVTQKEFLKGLRGAAAKTPSMTHLWVMDAPLEECHDKEEIFSALLGADLDALPRVEVKEQDTACILYTSGTTGHPKGAMLTHRNFVANSAACVNDLGLRQDDVSICLLPMFHSFAWTASVLVALRLGHKLVISTNITPAKPWLKLMARHGVTLIVCVPQIYAILAKEATGFKGLVMRWWFFRKVRVAVSGAAPLSPGILQAFHAAFHIQILEGYGLTETSPVVTANTLKDRKPGSVGRPITGVRIKLVDEEERELPIGEEGEICIAGPNVMKGYLNLPEATREAFTQDGWLKTGDIGLIDPEGFLFIRDRKKDMIIVKGLKVFSAQVEAVLSEHPDVQEAAVIGIPDEHGDELIKAFVIPRKGASPDKAALLAFCRRKLDPYKRPRDIEIVESLPKNALQKVLKRALRLQELRKRATDAP